MPASTGTTLACAVTGTSWELQNFLTCLLWGGGVKLGAVGQTERIPHGVGGVACHKLVRCMDRPCGDCRLVAAVPSWAGDEKSILDCLVYILWVTRGQPCAGMACISRRIDLASGGGIFVQPLSMPRDG